MSCFKQYATAQNRFFCKGHATTNMVLLIRLVEVSNMAKNANKKPADAGKKPAQKPAK